MTKTFTTAKIRKIGNDILIAWNEELRKEIKVRGKTLFNLIGLKKTIEEKYT
jgi:hypothetical protein